MYKLLKSTGCLIALLAISACEVQKSANPLSPAVAGPIPGVNITTPRLAEPATGSRIAASAQPITLTVENATSNGPRPLSYLFEVATDAQFTTKILSRADIAPGANGRTSTTLPALDSDKTYYWRALARDGANTGTYATVASFTIFTPAVLDVPTLVAPLNGAATSSLTPTLSFRNAVRSGPVAGVTYLLTINTAPTLPVASAVGFWWVPEQASGISTFVVPAGVLTAGKQYYWSVMSTDGTVGGNYSSVESFTTPTAPVASPPPGGTGGGGSTGGGTGGGGSTGGGTGGGGAAAGRDAINIGSVRFASPVNPAAYSPTIALTGVEFRSGDTFGLRAIFDRTAVNRRWPDVVVWPPAGNIQWTLYAGFQIGGVWHMGGFLEFWSDRNGAPRVWSGAHPLELAGGRTNWQANWAYDGRWGALSGYVPRAGDQMALMMVAGAVRPGSSNHPTVPERSNIIVVPLQLSGTF